MHDHSRPHPGARFDHTSARNVAIQGALTALAGERDGNNDSAKRTHENMLMRDGTRSTVLCVVLNSSQHKRARSARELSMRHTY